MGGVGGLPDTVAEHGDRGSGRLVVIRRKQASAEGAHSKGREITAGDVLRTERMGHGCDTLTPYAHPPAPGLEGGNLFEFRCFCLEALVQREGKHAPTILRPPLYAALVAFADAVEPARVRDVQGAEHYSVDQRTDGGSAANSQRKRQYCCSAKTK